MTSDFCNLKEKLNDIDEKQYQVIYDQKTNEIKKNCINIGSNKVPELVFVLKIKFLEYDCIITQYNISHKYINDELLQMIGLLFTKNDITFYSLDIMNINNTNDIGLYLKNHKTFEIEFIEKIEKYPGNDEIINLLLNKLSDEKITKIF
jgi:hypothetical protein